MSRFAIIASLLAQEACQKAQCLVVLLQGQNAGFIRDEGINNERTEALGEDGIDFP
jgi:hypothetical protein